MRHTQSAEGLPLLLIQQTLFAQQHGRRIRAFILAHDAAQRLRPALAKPRKQAVQPKRPLRRLKILRAVQAEAHTVLPQIRAEIKSAGVGRTLRRVETTRKPYSISRLRAFGNFAVKAPIGLSRHAFPIQRNVPQTAVLLRRAAGDNIVRQRSGDFIGALGRNRRMVHAPCPHSAHRANAQQDCGKFSLRQQDRAKQPQHRRQAKRPRYLRMKP